MTSRFLRRLWFLVCLSMSIALAGCDPPADFVEKALDETNDIELTVADPEHLDLMLSRNQGNVVLVDFWATWCGPCAEMFPTKVALQKKYASLGLVVISVSLDDAEQFSEARQFLFQQQAQGITHLISSLGAGTESMQAFEIDGGIPFVKLYDRTGELRYRFSIDERELETRIKQLLAEPDPGKLTPAEEDQMNKVLGNG